VLAILVTDLEGFTPLVDRLGDAAAQKLIQVHNRILRECVAEQLGGEVTHTGDGLITAFRSVARALQCAIEIQRMLGRYNRTHHGSSLRVRIGLHAGEPLPEDGRLFGACVITAVRICALAAAGQVLVSDLIWGLAAGREFDLRQRGPAPLKGFEQPVDLYELRWRARS
jgi:class 3 adenylate cyclase